MLLQEAQVGRGGGGHRFEDEGGGGRRGARFIDDPSDRAKEVTRPEVPIVVGGRERPVCGKERTKSAWLAGKRVIAAIIG